MFGTNTWTPAFRRAVEHEAPEALVLLAPLLDSEYDAPEGGMLHLLYWCKEKDERVAAVLSVCLTLMHQYEVTPGVLREWARSMKEANIRDYKNPTSDGRID